jgi:SPP1 gp7 family putative phage head morphogenesis protein
MLKLTNKKSSWVGKRNVAIKGTRLNYNVSDQLKYKRELMKLTRLMISESQKKILDLFRSDNSKQFFKQQKKAAMDASITSKSKKLLNELMSKFEKLFNSKAKELAEGMLEKTLKTSQSNLKTSLKQLSGGLSLNTGVVPKGMEEVSQAIINENVSLIKSIPSEYLDKVSGAVMRSITSGNGLADLEPEIKKYSGQSDRRVSLLALDQTRKAYNTINKQRMQSIGVKKFEWIHSGGGQHPRISHMKLDGKIFSFDDLPLKGEEGFVNGQIPGQAINCRCTMLPVIEFENGEEI